MTYELMPTILLGIFGNMKRAKLQQGFVEYVFTGVTDDNMFSTVKCLIGGTWYTVIELNYNNGQFLIFETARMLPMSDITVITNTFSQFWCNVTCGALRANIIDAIQRVPVV
jgi:hypothetical protein